ncbi:hypothetical protein Vafri_5078 [Volvox africanus]|uniref:Snurportin-1 n=1 Tax=Volvox africanus TaxID=51714 RepID=A0A8J4EVM6_9CHLO|nr:hypothetical protein Vafri_5078 [Volvox africanus]
MERSASSVPGRFWMDVASDKPDEPLLGLDTSPAPHRPAPPLPSLDPLSLRSLLRGRTVSWLRNGAPLHRFYSALPGGSPATTVGCGGSATAAAASGDYCLLDCIFHPPNNTYYVQDLLCWRGYALYDTAAEFRTFWLFSKFQEEGLLQLPRVEPCDAGDGVNGAREGVAGNMDTDMGRCSSSGNADGADDDSNGGRCGSQGSHRHCASESYRACAQPTAECRRRLRPAV